MKIATWNINGISSRLEQVIDWCGVNQPDVLCLQETKCVDARFPQQRFRSIGFENIEFAGEKAYNGVAIISKIPLVDVAKNFPDDGPDAPKRLIAATVRDIRIVNTYAPHGTKFASDKFTFKLEWLARLRRFFDDSYDLGSNVVLCGDLNVAPHELDVWKPSLWKDKMHFTKSERDSIRDLKKWGFVDVFRLINDDEQAFSWWSNFHHDFEKDRGLRIDHIWTSTPLAERCTDCWIDREPRSNDRPSDHAPVVANFAM